MWTKLLSGCLFAERCRVCREFCQGEDVHFAREDPCLKRTEHGSVTEEPRAVCASCWWEFGGGRPLVEWLTVNADTAVKIASGDCYRGAMKRLVYKLKYDGDRLLAADLAKLLVAAWPMVADAGGGIPAVLVPVPLHWKRQWKRGFNQAELLARHVGHTLRLPVDAQALRRVRETDAQHGLGRQERLANLAAAFQGNRPRLSGRCVVLVDDVYTSGATLAEAARTVLASGAQSVVGLTLARAILSNRLPADL